LKKIILNSISTILLLGTPALYAEAIKSPISTEKMDQGIAEAYEMLESMHMDETYSKMINQITNKMMQAQSASLPQQVKNDVKIMKNYNNILTNFLHKYIGWDKIKEDIARLYAKYYTASELKDIKTFYLTPIGQKSLKIMPEIMAESMQLSQSKLTPHMEELKENIINFAKNIKEKK